MYYCENCKCVVLEEDEFRDVVSFLDHLASLHLSSDFDLEEYLDDFNGILLDWDGGDDE